MVARISWYFPEGIVAVCTTPSHLHVSGKRVLADVYAICLFLNKIARCLNGDVDVCLYGGRFSHVENRWLSTVICVHLRHHRWEAVVTLVNMRGEQRVLEAKASILDISTVRMSAPLAAFICVAS